MDLQLYLRVIWRFKILVAVGFLLACGLAFLSLVKVSFEGGSVSFPYRQAETWASEATLLVTQPGFPEGRSITELYRFSVDPTTGREIAEPIFASSDRFADLASLYAQLATSDSVRQIMLEDGPIEGGIGAESLESSDGSALPLIEISAAADSPEVAQSLAQREVEAFLEFLEDEQRRSDISREDRIAVSLVGAPQGAQLIVPRKMTRPAVIFLTAMIAVLGLVFVLENIRPRIRPPAMGVDAPPPASERTRRSA
ncbi:MAG: hypothetical protein ACRDOS_00220 [Gaiellaceae bacterium]